MAEKKRPARKSGRSQRRRLWMPRSRKGKIIYLCVLAVLALGLLISDALRPEAETVSPGADSDFAVYYLDVGQADSALIVCSGETMLIDGGNVSDDEIVCTALENLEISELDYVVCTHAHEDHVGGLAGVLDRYPAGTVYCSVDEAETRCFRNFVDSARNQGKEIGIPVAGDRFSLGDSTVTILGPLWDYDDTNSQSVVLRIDYGETSFLFTGDTTAEAEYDVLAEGENIECTVLKVAHHGSSTSSTPEWLDASRPRYAVISCGEGNSYGHPHKEVMDRLEERNITVYRTDLNGTVACLSDGENVTFYTDRDVG